jgi:hypothetical protein
MGSSGNNTFGNYAPSGTTKCDDTLDAELEDVARHEYYKKHSRVPPKSTLVRVRKGQLAGRLVVEEVATSDVIGNLPTRLNYLALCQEKDYEYKGEVTASRNGKTPTVEVHLDPV